MVASGVLQVETLIFEQKETVFP